MKKFALLVALLVGMATAADAQPVFRVGGGLIFDGTVFGGGAAVDIPLSDQPFGLTIQGEYYKKSGVTTVPLRVMGVYRAPAGEQADFYIGAGSGLIYSKVSIGAASASTTKALGTAVAGLNFKASDSFGVFGEVGIDRAITSGAKNNFGARVGISFGGAE